MTELERWIGFLLISAFIGALLLWINSLKNKVEHLRKLLLLSENNNVLSKMAEKELLEIFDDLVLIEDHSRRKELYFDMRNKMKINDNIAQSNVKNLI